MPSHSSQARADLHEAKRQKASVRVASTTNVSVSAPGATIDGVTMVSGEDVGLFGQTTASQNGLYTWHGSASAMTRRTDASASTDMLAGDQVYVRGALVSADLPASPDFAIGANGQAIGIRALTELTTIAAAATTTTAIQIPAAAIVLAVSVRVTVAIPTATTFTVTGNTSGTTYNTAAVSVAANSTDPGTAAGAVYNGTAQTVRITPSATPATNVGRVRVTVFYLLSTPPTS
jgi:hypothetical protein